jgi:hypothetical protein
MNAFVKFDTILVPYRQRRGYANAKRLPGQRGYANDRLIHTTTHNLGIFRYVYENRHKFIS